MASEIRVNSLTSRTGLGTVTFGDSGPVISGIISAISYVGDGSNMTGVATTKNLTIGTRTTAATISVVGTGMTISLRSGIATVNF
jgi:hypothetical protein